MLPTRAERVANTVGWSVASSGIKCFISSAGPMALTSKARISAGAFRASSRFSGPTPSISSAPVASITQCTAPPCAACCAQAWMLASFSREKAGVPLRHKATTSAKRASARNKSTKAAPSAPLAPSTTARRPVRASLPGIQAAPAAILRSACSNTSTGCPPEIRWRSLMMMAGTERMPAPW